MSKVVKLDVTALKDIVKNDESKLIKLQKLLSYRVLSINNDSFKRLSLLSEQNLRFLSLMGDIKIYTAN